jgi:hypothetical protein
VTGVRWIRRALTSLSRPFAVAKQALRQKKLYENELDSISGRKMTLTTQVPEASCWWSSGSRDRRRNTEVQRAGLTVFYATGQRHRVGQHE